jgi:glycosyltransferase involved in cell wall biosynthesis
MRTPAPGRGFPTPAAQTHARRTPLRANTAALPRTRADGRLPGAQVASELEAKYPRNFKAVLSFKGQEKYKTYAAADFALMPSRYEPCGLVQMEGMRFGVLPIVAPTGGLADTVTDLKASALPPPARFALCLRRATPAPSQAGVSWVAPRSACLPFITQALTWSYWFRREGGGVADWPGDGAGAGHG